MSTSSGISVSESLRTQFSNAARTGGPRLLQVIIENERELVVKKVLQPNADWEKDFDLTGQVVTEKDACYILFRTDVQNSQGDYLWYLLRFVPDKAKVRDKMLYASTVATLKQELGSGLFVEDIFGTVPNDINAKGYRAHAQHKDAAVPLTEEEKQKQEERREGVFSGGSGTGSAYVHGVAFPIDQDVRDCLQDFKSGALNYVQLDIDLEKEIIILADAQSVTIEGASALFPSHLPRFHFYRWDHEHEGDQVSSIIYVYSCPDGSHGTTSAPVKHRMLFSSSKANVASLMDSIGLQINAKLEVNAGMEFSESELRVLLHPPKAEAKKVVSKPKPQAARKLIRGNQ